jgi:hypothetical protein
VISKRTTGAVDVVNAHGSQGLNVAVSGWIPGGKINGPPIAVPVVTVTGSPRLMPAFLNWTVPAAAAGVTVAVNVTGVPWATGDAG